MAKVAYSISNYLADIDSQGGGGGDLDAERAERIAADQVLQDNIDAERAAREAADQALEDKIGSSLVFREATIFYEDTAPLHVPSLADADEYPANVEVLVERGEGIKPLKVVSAQFWSDRDFMQIQESILVMGNDVETGDDYYLLQSMFRGTRIAFDAQCVKVGYLAEVIQ